MGVAISPDDVLKLLNTPPPPPPPEPLARPSAGLASLPPPPPPPTIKKSNVEGAEENILLDKLPNDPFADSLINPNPDTLNRNKNQLPGKVITIPNE